MNDLLTVREVAEYAGITPQAIRSRLKKDLQTYVTTVDNQTMLDKSVLEKYTPKKVDNNVANVANPTQESIIATIEILKEQLAVKDKQIEGKDRQLEARDIHITDLTARIEAAQDLQKSSQILLAQKEQQLLEPPAEPQKKSLFKKLFHKD